MGTVRECKHTTYYDLHAIPSYKEHLYKERLVKLLEYKERRLVNIQIIKERVPQVDLSNSLT